VKNMTTLVDMGLRYGVPTMGVTAVGKELTRDARYLGLARASAQSSAHKSSRPITAPEGFERVTAGCPVPIVMAGAEAAGARRAHDGLQRREPGRRRVDMGRNIFQSDAAGRRDTSGREGRA